MKKSPVPIVFWERGNTEFSFCLKLGKLVGRFHKERILRPHLVGKGKAVYYQGQQLPLKSSYRERG